MSTNSHKDPKILLKRVTFAKKLHKELQDIQNEVNWADILQAENSYDVISSLANEFVHDINILIYNLHQIMIRINKNQSSYNDLKVLVNKLSKISCELQEAFGQDYSVLKSKMITQIQNVVKEAQSFLNIVEKDELYEFKAELVDSLSEILSDLQKVLTYNQLKQLTSEELNKVFDAYEQNCRNVVAANHLQNFSKCVDKTILEGVTRHTLNGVVCEQRIVFNLHKVSNNYDDPIKAQINQAAKNLNKVCMDITVALYQVNSGGEGTSALEQCIIGGFQAFRDIMELRNFIDCNKTEKDSENLKNLMYYGLSTSLCMARRFVQDMSMEVLGKT